MPKDGRPYGPTMGSGRLDTPATPRASVVPPVPLLVSCFAPESARPGPESPSLKGEVRMSRIAFRAAWLLLLGVAAALPIPAAWAGTTGKLAGKVTNEKKEPLAGVNIRVEGQRLGAISDDKGNYFIIGIPGGSYTVRANLLGQAPFVAENVTINPDFTTPLNIVLRTEAVQLQEVRVEAERP